MKRIVWPLLLILLLALAACGGGTAEEPAAEPPAADTGAEAVEPATEEETVEQATEVPEAAEVPAEAPEAAPAEEVPVEEAAAGDMIAGLPASGIDPDSGFEINPAQVEPGIDYIVRGELVNFALIPTDKPEFMIESPEGVRYRVQSQALDQVIYTDGTTLAPHQYKRGMLAQATARLMESETATSIMISSDMVLLPAE